MITEKIKAVFEFINFLNSNTQLFKEFATTADESSIIDKEMSLLRPDNSFEERKKYNELQTKKNAIIQVVMTNVVEVITKKALSLNICNKTSNGLDLNWGFDEIQELKQEADENDIKTIIEHKKRYLEFRNETNNYFLSLHFFFTELDRYFKNLFGFFDNGAIVEFEKLDEIAIPVKKSDNVQPFNIDDFKFSPDILIKSKEDFQILLNQRYEDKLEPDQINQIVEKYYGENRANVQRDAKNKVEQKEYINSVYNYGNFKKAMEDKTSRFYYSKLVNIWKERQKEYLLKNNTIDIPNNWYILFGRYLSDIFEIYRFALKYKESNDNGWLDRTKIHKARLDILINENIDFFTDHLAYQKIAGEYKKVIDRKDYLILLFNSLERFLPEASINFSKSPFVEIFATSKEKIKNCVSFEEIKFLATSANQLITPKEYEKIDWINVFNQIDIEENIERQIHLTTVYEQKKDYFSKASFNLTSQYLQTFKRETDFLTFPRKLDFIKALNIVPPKIGQSENATFNQTVFEAQQNYYEFIMAYKTFITASLQQQTKVTFQAPLNNTNTLSKLNSICFDDIKQSQNQLIPKVSIQNVYDHFKQLTSMTNKMDEFYLTENQLLNFINNTFILKKPIRQNFNCNGFVKKEVRSIFYKFYFDNKNKEGKLTNIKRKYFNIMNDSFEGFNENDYTDFAK